MTASRPNVATNSLSELRGPGALVTRREEQRGSSNIDVRHGDAREGAGELREHVRGDLTPREPPLAWRPRG